MGILDDAIREHLELKRQHGAESDDLERLENEAFGALARPGDPDFAEPDENGEAEPGEEPVDSEPGTEPSTSSTSDWLATEAPTTVAPAAETTPEPTVAEQAQAEVPQLEDTADREGLDIGPGGTVRADAPQSPEPPAVAEQPPMAEPLPPSERSPAPDRVEPEPPEAPERGIFDADADDIDLGDLDLDEEDDGTASPQPASAEESPFLLEEDDLSLDLDDDEPLSGEFAATSFEEPPPRAPVTEEDTGNPPLPVPPRAPDPDGPPAPEPPREDASEDLLEETPDFLRDTPEGDRAWFEQDPPKDFDFDDD